MLICIFLIFVKTKVLLLNEVLKVFICSIFQEGENSGKRKAEEDEEAAAKKHKKYVISDEEEEEDE